MPTIELPSLADHVRTLPLEGAARDRQIHRLIELKASAEAAAALQTAAASGGNAGVVGKALNSAAAVMNASLLDRSVTNDETRDRLRDTVMSADFLVLIPGWVAELRQTASSKADTGACTVATALELWSLTVAHLRATAEWPRIADELAEAICPLLAARFMALEIATTPAAPDEAQLQSDLCHVHAARASATAGATCAELVFGYRRHLVWDIKGCSTCYSTDDLDDLEAFMPGIASGAHTTPDLLETDGSHPAKEGPCARFDGVNAFMRLRHRLDGCLTGARIARDRVAVAIGHTMNTATKGRA